MRKHLLLILAAGSLTFLLGLGQSPLTDSDEAFYAEAAREMLERHDWLTPYFNYATRFQKPIFFYWMVATSYLVAGISEAVARVPAALSGLGLALLTYALGRRWYAEREAFLAAMIVASSFGLVSLARISLPDLPLAFFMVVTTWACTEAFGRPLDRNSASASAGERVWWLRLAAVAAGLGVLTKGPVAVVLPLLAVIPILALEREPTGSGWWSRFLRVSPRHVLEAAAIFILVTAPWFVAMALEHGVGYLQHFFVAENLERFATARYNQPRSVFFYVPIVLGGLLPWSPFLILTAMAAFTCARARQPPSQASARLVLFAALPLLFYSISIGKQPRYILPVLPPLALLVARAIERDGEMRGGRSQLVRVIGAICGLGLLLAGLLVYRWYDRGANGTIVMNTAELSATSLILMASGALVGLTAWLASVRQMLTVLTVTSIVAQVTVSLTLLTAGSHTVTSMAKLVEANAEGVGAIGTYQSFVRNLVFYIHRPTFDLINDEEALKFLNRDDRVLCVVPESDLSRLEALANTRWTRLGQLAYTNTAGLRLRSFVDPDAPSDFQTVVLIANR